MTYSTQYQPPSRVSYVWRLPLSLVLAVFALACFALDDVINRTRRWYRG